MRRLKKAVIVAAGTSSRLYPLTENLPKALLKIGSETIIERTLRLLDKAGVPDIAIVVGFLKEKIIHLLGSRFTFVVNPEYARTNNMASLWYARDWVGQDPFLYLHSDIVFDEWLLQFFLEGEDSGEINLLVDFDSVDEEAMKVRVDQERNLIESHKGIPLSQAHGEWVGMAKTTTEGSGHLFEEIDRLMSIGEKRAYDTLALTNLAGRGVIIGTKATQTLPWIEIDTVKDYRRALKIFDMRG